MKKVRIETTEYQVAERWDELTTDQVNNLLPLQLTNPDDLPPEKRGLLKAMALKVLLPGMGQYINQLTDSQFFSLSRLTNWIWKSKVTTKPFNYFTTTDEKGKTFAYILPEDNFSNTTAIEIAMANIYYLSFTRPQNPNPNAALLLIATLCRPERKDLKKFQASVDWNGDPREEYNTILAEERANQFKTLPMGTIMAVLQYFEAMNARFLNAYKDVYEPDPNAEEEAPLYKNGEGLITTLMDVAKTGVFGDFEKVGKQNGHTVWLYLRDNNLKIRRDNARAEKARMENS